MPLPAGKNLEAGSYMLVVSWLECVLHQQIHRLTKVHRFSVTVVPGLAILSFTIRGQIDDHTTSATACLYFNNMW